MNQMSSKMQNGMILLIGLPGSGKSTWAERYATNRKHTVIISSDKIREELYGDAAKQGDNNKIFSLVKERAEEALRNCKNVIIDATNLTVKDRSVYFDIAIDFDATVTGILFDIPVEECKHRNSKRDRVVPDFVYDKMVKRYEQPQLSEGFTMLIRIGKED